MARSVEINGRCFWWEDWPVSVGEDVLHEARQILAQWSTHFPVEPTWIQRRWQVPAGLVRLDCVVSPGADFGGAGTPPCVDVYEIEDRPSKIGLMATCNDAFRSRLAMITNEWAASDSSYGPLCVVYLNEAERRLADDDGWAEVCSLREALRDKRLLLTRGFPSDDDYGDIAQASVFALRHHSDKIYGERLGWWQRATMTDLAANSGVWKSPFALKPCSGESGRAVMLWAPDARSDGIAGADTAEEIRQVMERHGTMYLQAFIPPMRCPHLDHWFMIYRIYFGYSVLSGKYVALGGLWSARQRHLKLVGGDDEIYGPLDIPDVS